MRLARFIFPFLTFFLVAVSCGKKEGRVIPRGKLAEIYAEMLVTDQWIADHSQMRRMADTSLVYEPIFEKYGYTSADYRKSVDVYMDDPERFSRILRTTVGIFDKKLKELKIRQEEEAKAEALRLMREKMKIRVEFDIDAANPFLFKEPYMHFYDSLAVECDSIDVYRLRNIERTDTIFKGPLMVVKDSVSVADSIFVK